MLTYGIIGEQENQAMGEEFSSQCSLVVKPETQRYLHYCEILTNSSIPKVIFNIHTNSEAQHACHSAGSG